MSSSASGPSSRVTPPAVLVVGGGGFIGSYIVAALRVRGWQVRNLVRTARADGDFAGELSHLCTPEAWLPYLDGVDAVVNAAGILREQRGQRFDLVHEYAPLALAAACRTAGIRRFVQISALGDPADGEFMASKHRADAALLAMEGLEAVVLRPSVVYSATGSYGGTSLLRALAAFPGVQPVPGQGNWPLQPLAAEDLATVVVRALERTATGLFEVGGPEPITLGDYLRRWRGWLRLPPAPVIRVPAALVTLLVAIAERVGNGPLSLATWRMLRRGSTTAPGAGERVRAAFDVSPRPLDAVLAATPSQAQDRWHARLWLLEPLLRSGVVVLFLLSAWAGFATPAEEIERLARGSTMLPAPVWMARGSAAVDLVLSALLIARWRERLTIGLMLALVAGYTLVIGIALPEAWLDALGGLAKNLVVIPALAVLLVLADRR